MELLNGASSDAGGPAREDNNFVLQSIQKGRADLYVCHCECVFNRSRTALWLCGEYRPQMGQISGLFIHVPSLEGLRE